MNNSNTASIEFQIAQVSNLWRKVQNRNNKKLGLTVSERRVLIAIDQNPAQAQSAIALYLDMEPQNLLRLIDSLEKGEYLERQASSKDRRVKTLHLLPAGKKMVDDIYNIADRFRGDFLEGIPQETLSATTTALKSIEENLLTSGLL